MSLEAFGDEGEPGIDVDTLYAHRWESDADCVVWWKEGDPDTKYTIQEAWQVFEESRWDDD